MKKNIKKKLWSLSYTYNYKDEVYLRIKNIKKKLKTYKQKHNKEKSLKNITVKRFSYEIKNK